MIRFEDIADAVRAHSPDADLELLRRAYVFSAMEHKGQLRHSGEPYLVHPLAVAQTLAAWKCDVVTVAAGLLHDLVEDTLTTPERLHDLFGPEVAGVVLGVTKVSVLPIVHTEEDRQVANLRKLMLAVSSEPRVMVVKLADRLHNMRTLQHLPPDRARRVADDTLKIYAPIAGRLGMSSLRSELEDLAFLTLLPIAYESVRSSVRERHQATETVLTRLKQDLRETLASGGVQIVGIEGRIKSLYSIHSKMERLGVPFDEVTDLIGLRVVALSTEDCYAALGVIHGRWEPIAERIRDFVANPRINGYQALHTTVSNDHQVTFEVQIRTAAMHQMAEGGAAEHWRYKDGKMDRDADRQPRGHLTLIEHVAAGEVNRLERDEVLVYTASGELHAMPRGATVLDFAYAVDVELAHKCAGARVNGRQAPLRSIVRNGDIVDLLIDPKRRPSRDWLGFVVTSWAHQQLETFFGVGTRFDAAPMRPLGRNGGRILQRVDPNSYDESYPPAHTRSEASASPSDRQRSLVLRARCCGPIRGESIVGCRLPSSDDMIIHTRGCLNVTGDPVSLGEFEPTASGEAPADQHVALRVELDWSPAGTLAKVSDVVVGTGASVRSLRRVGQRRLLVGLCVRDVGHLAAVTHALSSVESVAAVRRARS